MNEILEYPVQTGNDTLTNSGYDVVFDHVGFAYPGGEVVLKDVSFTAKQGEVSACRSFGRRKNNGFKACRKVLGYSER